MLIVFQAPRYVSHEWTPSVICTTTLGVAWVVRFSPTIPL